MKTNKNGVKLLAIVMVFAMAFACITICGYDSTAEDAKEEAPTTVYISATGKDDNTGVDAENALLTLDAALKTKATTIKLASNYTITGPVTIPSGVTINNNTKILTISGTLTLNGGLVLDDRTHLIEDSKGCKIVISSTSTVTLGKTPLLSAETVKLNSGASAEVQKLNEPNGFIMHVTAGIVDVGAGYTGMGDQTTITVDSGATVNIKTSATNKGTLIVNGTLSVEAAVANSGTITINGTVALKAAVTNNGTINLNGTVTKNGGSITNNKDINVADGANNTNALGIIETAGITGSGKVAGNGWSITGTTLTLEDYNGKQYFDGAFTTVTLSGTNVISLTKAAGVMEKDEIFAAIKTSATTLNIGGTNLQVGITIGKGVTANSTGENNTNKIAGIYAGTAKSTVTITNKDLKISITGDIVIPSGKVYNQAIYGVYSSQDLVVGGYVKDKESENIVVTPVAVDVSVSPSSAYGFGFTGITKAQFTMTGSVEAGNRALFVSTSKTGENGMILKGCGTASAPLVLIASEKAIQAKSSDMKVVASNIDARISGNELYNHGNDDVWGIMAGTLNVDSSSTVKTEGLRINGKTGTTLTNNGIIIVSGDYFQNPQSVTNDSATKPLVTIAGFYYDNTETDYTNVTEKSATAEKVYLTNGAQTYGKLTVDSKKSDVATDATTAETKFGTASTVTMTSGSDVASITIPANKTLQIGDAVTFANDAILTINNGSEIQFSTPSTAMTVTIKNAGVGGSVAKFENVKGTFTVTYGSIVIDSREIVEGSVSVPNGTTVKISGFVSDEFTINGPTGDGTSATVLVEEGTTFKIGEDATLTLNGNIKMNNDGQVIGGGEIIVNKPAQFYTSNPVSVTFSGDGKIILEDATETLKLSDKLASSITAEPTQKVIITGNLTIKENQYLIVNGDLEIPEGVTVTIENGGYLMLKSPTASATIAGTIKSLGVKDSIAGFTIESSVVKDVVITGEIIAGKTTEGQKSVYIGGYAYLEGTVTVSAKAAAQFVNLNVAEGGNVNVKGTITGTIYNQGTVTMDGSTTGTTIIYNQATTAVVNVDSLASGVLTVSDKGLYLQTIDSTRYYVPETIGVNDWTSENKVSFENVEGITVTETLKYATVNGERHAYNHMEIQGSISVSNTKEGTIAAPVMTIVKGTVDAIETIDLSKAEIVVDGHLIVYGTIYVDDSDMPTGVPTTGTARIGITVNGELTVYGLVRAIEIPITNENNVNAVKYEQKADTKDVYYYTNLADAIASGVKDLEVLGDLEILKDTVIPAGIEIDGASSDITIGSPENTEVTLTVADGGYLAFDNVEVLGTFVIENTDDGVNKLRNIVSDTSVISENTAMYTNLLNALNNAESGEVKITKTDDGIVTLSADATVRKDVTLVVPTSKTLTIVNGVTLTVEGTLDLKGTMNDKVAENDTDGNKNGFNTQTAVPGHPEILFSVVKVTGTVIGAAPMDYDDYYIPGAYYELKGKYYITTIDQAAPVIKTVDGSKIDIYGENKVGTIVFEGTAMIPAVVNVHGKITAESMTVAFGTITVDTGKLIDGTFGSSVGSITVANMKVTDTLVITDTVVTIDDVDVQKFILSGKVATNTDKITTASSLTFNGKVEISKNNFEVSANYTSTSGKTFGSITVAEDATVTVSGKNLTITSTETSVKSKITVNGELITRAAGKIDSNTLIVMGTLDIREAQGSVSAGTIAVKNLYIGGTTSDVKTVGGNAAVNAPLEGIDVVYMFPGSTVTGTLNVKLAAEDVVKTEFYIEDVLWMTVYDLTNQNLKIVNEDGTINFKPLKIKEKQFVSWQYQSSGKMYDVGKGKTVGSYSKVYANIDYKVYGIGVYACEGIDDVFIDGDIMVFSQITDDVSGGSVTVGMFSAMVAAGEHTITYTLTNGYSGTATMTVNNDKVTGYKFTAGGDFGTGVEYTITLQGIEKSGYVPDTPEPTPVEPTEKDDSLGITEYLLIVLVVLAAILVVVVAIRMMRS